MRKIILTTLLSLAVITSTFAQKYSGMVYVDANKNGKYDKGEKVLKGISVSDGLNVTKTDAKGQFSLPGHDKERFIFITTPSGYQTNNAHYQKIEASTSSYDFGLQTSKKTISKKGEHSFIQLADTEIFNTENHEDWVSNIRNYAANEEVAFIMHTGDICYDNGLRKHIKLMNADNMDCPVFYAIGNHDLVAGEYGEQLFESIYGPVYFSFEVGNVHYIVTPMLSGDYKPSYTKADVYKWFKNDIANVEAGKPIIVFSHDLLTNSDDFKYGVSETEFVDLNKHNLKAWIYGHWHINLMKKQGNVYSICTSTPDKGGIDHSTANFRVIDVNSKGDIKSHLQYPYVAKNIQITSILNNQTIYNNGSVKLSVNTYDSNSKTKNVTYTCFADNKQIAKGNLKQQTDWNWTAELKLPAKLIDKKVEVVVSATFNDGTTVEKKEAFIHNNKNTNITEKLNNWQTLLGSANHNGATKTNIKTPLSLAWSTNIGANIFMSSPLIYNGNVYVASVDENLKGEAHIYALDGSNGNLLWKYKTQSSIKNSIAIQAGNVLAQDVEGTLYAVDATTGTLSWSKKLNQKGLPGLVEGLTAKDGIVYAGTGKGLSAIKAESGEVLWTNQDWNQGEGSTNTIAVGNNIVVNGTQWGALYANDATTGKIIVRKELPVNVDATSTPLLTDKEIIFGSAEAGIIALDNETLEIKWQFATNKALIYTSPYTRAPFATVETSLLLSGNAVIFGASDGVLYGINIETGKQEFEFNVGAPIINTPAISGNNIFFSDFGGSVYAISGTE